MFCNCSSLFNVRQSHIVISTNMPGFSVCAAPEMWEKLFQGEREAWNAFYSVFSRADDEYCPNNNGKNRVLMTRESEEWQYYNDQGELCVPFFCEY